MAAERPKEPQASAPARHVAWLALLVVAAVELVGHYVIQARVVTDAEWAAAAARVREEWREGDVIAPAPEWTDPLMRRELGDLISLVDAGRMGLDGYQRLWTISARGHLPEEAPDAPPDLDEQIGPLRVLRWTLSEPEVLYRFTEHVREARVTMRVDGQDQPCRWQTTGRPRGGGLGQGPVTPAARHVCDPRRGWLWVGTTVQDDLSLEPRYCIWTHPAGPEPIRVTFPNVPLGDELALAGDYYYEHERHLEHGPTEVAVLLNGAPIGRMTHRDGDGFKRMTLSTRVASRGGGDVGEVTVEVSAVDPNLRTFCWAAHTREGSR